MNVLPLQYYNKLPLRPGLIKGSHKLTSYCGSAIPYAGISYLTCQYKEGKTQSHAFYIVRSNTTPIVGRKTCKDLELIMLILNIKKEDRTTSACSKLVNEYKDILKGIGNLENKCEIHLKENSVPTVYPARKVPLAMKQKLTDELDRLEALNIIEKISEAPDWVNTMVIVKKKDESARLCIDPVDLNKAIRRPCQVQQPRKNSKPFWACSTSYPDTSQVSHSETRPYETSYKNSRTVDLKVDAPKHELGAEILTNGNICGYASRAFSKTEQNYSQLEKEMFAIVNGSKYFHHYIYKREVTVTTDHRPMETILSKPLHQAPIRLQRIMIQTLPYDLEVIYSPGSDIPIADALSRLYLPYTDFQMQRDIEAYVHAVMKTLPVSDSKLRKIRQLTEHYNQLSTFQSVMQCGWPST
ncbi:hypothetical protein QYM36_009479 [Artemia franciscana]|uniref:Reverse transcriptase RNase H-like domain-containing protein n=1 Tax=Artemia franciscana TaxID=6661 RepID=A0AA88HLY7_ARTSF|nr:hypothetical protein QYM36_009479 [Artemia franciscana]